MAGLLTASFLVCLWVTVAAGDPLPTRIVDHRPGALEAVQRSNPTDYEKIQKIMERVLQQPDADGPHWIQENFDARYATYGPIVLTSFPRKRRLLSMLNGTWYEAVVILMNARGEIVPVK